MNGCCISDNQGVSCIIMRCSKDILFSAALLLITALVLSFLHSELGMWDFDSDEHAQHDFCDLVNNAPTIQKVMKQDTVKDMAPAEICPDAVVPARLESASCILPGSILRVTHDVLYLDNRILLI